MLKVEIAKLEQAFKKFKATVPRGFNKLNVQLPDYIQYGQQVSTQETVFEIQKIRHLLVTETHNYLCE